MMGDSPVIAKTIERLNGYGDRIIIAAPEFDRGGLDFLDTGDAKLSIHYGQDESPLLRIVKATSDLADDTCILRVNALNFCVDMEAAVEMQRLALTVGFDVVRFPENFPALFSSDVYRLSALRRLADINPDLKYHVHPKYVMTESNGFMPLVFTPSLDRYTDDLLRTVREACASSIYGNRIEVDLSKTIKAGDSICHHYEMVLPYLESGYQVLDMACGSGFGTAIMSGSVGKVTGIDIDGSQLGAFEWPGQRDNIELVTADCLDTGLPSGQYDCITAFEIIEHVEPHAMLGEISRLLKPGAHCFISTPQNVLGHIPTTPDHVMEYSLSGLLEIVSRYFDVERVIGIKQGTIYFEGDPVGSNSFLVCRKS
ncbi:MAG: methyltransferase domain-containing protein [Chlorobiaceae bacterium]|nr:methyltransferase domain-containing protein [Chlorobiaceae bacterium]